MINPADPDRLWTFVTNSSIGIVSLGDTFDARDWTFDAIRGETNTTDSVADEQHDVLTGLYRNLEKRFVFQSQSAGNCITNIIEML